MVKRLATVFALAVPREETREIAHYRAFLQRVASMIRKRLANEGDPSTGSSSNPQSRDIDAATSGKSSEARSQQAKIDLFAAPGSLPRGSTYSATNSLSAYRPSRKRTSPLETLRKLLNDQIKTSERTSRVQAQKFAKR